MLKRTFHRELTSTRSSFSPIRWASSSRIPTQVVRPLESLLQVLDLIVSEDGPVPSLPLLTALDKFGLRQEGGGRVRGVHVLRSCEEMNRTLQGEEEQDVEKMRKMLEGEGMQDVGKIIVVLECCDRYQAQGLSPETKC